MLWRGRKNTGRINTLRYLLSINDEIRKSASLLERDIRASAPKLSWTHDESGGEINTAKTFL